MAAEIRLTINRLIFKKCSIYLFSID